MLGHHGLKAGERDASHTVIRPQFGFIGNSVSTWLTSGLMMDGHTGAPRRQRRAGEHASVQTHALHLSASWTLALGRGFLPLTLVSLGHTHRPGITRVLPLEPSILLRSEKMPSQRQRGSPRLLLPSAQQTISCQGAVSNFPHPALPVGAGRPLVHRQGRGCGEDSGPQAGWWVADPHL